MHDDIKNRSITLLKCYNNGITAIYPAPVQKAKIYLSSLSDFFAKCSEIQRAQFNHTCFLYDTKLFKKLSETFCSH